MGNGFQCFVGIDGYLVLLLPNGAELAFGRADVVQSKLAHTKLVLANILEDRVSLGFLVIAMIQLVGRELCRHNLQLIKTALSGDETGVVANAEQRSGPLGGNSFAAGLCRFLTRKPVSRRLTCEPRGVRCLLNIVQSTLLVNRISKGLDEIKSRAIMYSFAI